MPSKQRKETVVKVGGFLGRFLQERRQDLVRIARQSRGRAEVGDLVSEAWLFVTEQELKRGAPFDPASTQNQEFVLGFLYNKHINFVNPVSRYSISLDQIREDDGGDELPALIDRQRAPETCEPLQYLLSIDAGLTDPFAVVTASYSQAAAYIILLERSAWSAADLAESFSISIRALVARFVLARDIMREQPSLFDGIERVRQDFQPYRKRRLMVMPVLPATGEQRVLVGLERDAWHDEAAIA